MIERTWRKVSGKKKTKAEEREAREKKKAKEAKVGGGDEGDLGTTEVYQGLTGGKDDDAIIR